MRFKPYLPILTLVTTAVFILHLGLSGDLDVYIHPRYIIFTIALSTVGLAILVLHAYTSSEKHADTSKTWSLIPLLIVVCAALVLPVRPLSSATVSQRSIDTVPTAGLSSSSQPLSTLFAGSSKGLKLADWARLLKAQTDESYYSQKTAVISGFLYDAELGSDTVWLSRFVLSCCAVDAQPVGVPVQISDWRSTYEQDQWIEVEGLFRLAETQQGAQLVLIPDDIRNIDEPDNPYAN